jgi:hypothetical protein
VRFRVYAFDSDHKALGEIKARDGVKIEWTVQIANKKASWYQFQGKDFPLLGLRNPTVQVFTFALHQFNISTK